MPEKADIYDTVIYIHVIIAVKEYSGREQCRTGFLQFRSGGVYG